MALLTICDENKVERKFFIRQLEEGYSVYLHSLSCMKNSHEWRKKFPRVTAIIATSGEKDSHEWRITAHHELSKYSSSRGEAVAIQVGGKQV